MSECVVCTSPPGAGYLLCPRCGDSLADDLQDVAGLIPHPARGEYLPSLADELDATATRQDHLGGERVGSRSTETGLAWKEPAAEAAFFLHGTLAAAARDLAAIRKVTVDARTTAELAVWLRNRIDWLRACEGIEETFGAILAAVRQARRAVDRPAVLPYAGRCHDCSEHMYARMDGPVVTCRACAYQHRTEHLRASLQQAIWHELRTASEIAAALSTYLPQPLPFSTIKTWIARKQLLPKGEELGDDEPQGRALYRIGDVIELALRRQSRRGNGTAA